MIHLCDLPKPSPFDPNEPFGDDRDDADYDYRAVPILPIVREYLHQLARSQDDWAMVLLHPELRHKERFGSVYDSIDGDMCRFRSMLYCHAANGIPVQCAIGWVYSKARDAVYRFNYWQRKKYPIDWRPGIGGYRCPNQAYNDLLNAALHCARVTGEVLPGGFGRYKTFMDGQDEPPADYADDSKWKMPN